MLRLHVVHLLHHGVAHLASLEDGVRQASVPGVGDGLMVDHVLDWKLFKELADFLLLVGRLEVRLLALVLFLLRQELFLRLPTFLRCCGTRSGSALRLAGGRRAEHRRVWVQIFGLWDMTIRCG